jgi:outer membrane protein insertion porin family
LNWLLGIIVALAFTTSALAQGPYGGFPSMPQSMFGGKKDKPTEASGPSLSATDEPVAEIRIVGNKTIPRDVILNELQTRVGRPFDPALVQRDVRKLASGGRFVDVQPTYEQAPTGRVVIFKVIERPVIRYVYYMGNRGIRDKKLASETELKIGGPVDPYAVEEARRKIVALYGRSGYNDAQVTILEGNKPTDIGVTFVIHEGTPQKIWKVEFVGAQFVSNHRLKTQVQSKPPLAYIFKGFVDDELIDADVERIKAYYRSFGFFQAKVGRRLIPNEKGNWVTLQFVVDEGPRYQVENVSFLGNKVFATDSLALGIELTGSKPFEQAKMNTDVEWLKELYGSQGYVFADIQAELVYSEQPGKLDVMYKIDEGKRWRVGNINVHIDGDTPHTKISTAINRLSVRPGEIVDIRELRASERRLQASGLFMTDPVRGVMPKITYHIPELDDIETASGEDSPGFRGQSPDGHRGERGAGSREQGAGSSEWDPNTPQLSNPGSTSGPPLMAPPAPWSPNGSPARMSPPVNIAPGRRRTFRVIPPAGFVSGDDQIDVDIFIDRQIEQPATAAPEPPLSPTAVQHEVRRWPFSDDATSTANSQPSASAPSRSAYSGTRRQSYQAYSYVSEPAPPSGVIVQQPGRATTNSYRQLTIRTQSPYQAATTSSHAGGQPAAAQYGAAAYGGQTVGATGPDSIPAGNSAYAVRQAAISEAQLPPARSATPATLAQAPAGAPAFAPPPMMAPPQGPYTGGPGYAAPPGPPVSYGPPPVLPPDPNITPVAPLPTNPQLSPYQPLDPFSPMYVEPSVDLDVALAEAQTGRLMLGVAVNSDAGLVGQILLDEQNFDWSRFPTSWDDFASGRAWRGAGQRFRLEAAPGTEVQRYLVSFTEPYLWGTPVSLGLSGSYFDRRYIDWDEQRLGGRVSTGYQWTENDLSAAISYRGENINIRNISAPIPELLEVNGDNVLHGFKISVANDTRDSAFLATQGHYIELSFEQVVGSFIYPRVVLDARQYFMLSERPDHSGRHVVTLSSRVGITGDDTPIYENFFAGGYSTLRGYDFRGASPVKSGVQVGGEFMWVNTVEYLFPLTADDMIHGVAFCDFGTVEEDVEIKDFRVAPGFGLRITVPAMGPAPIALDFAFPIVSADFDDEQVFSFNIGLQR